jgi:hypothetical protein
MIGDRWESDILGARRAGIQALLLDRSGAENNKADCLRGLTDLTTLFCGPHGEHGKVHIDVAGSETDSNADK